MANEHDQSQPHSSAAAEADVASSASPDSGDATPVGNDSADRLVETLNAGVDRVLRAFDEKIRYDATKQQAIDRQHEELVGYRADLVARAARPFVYGMIHHHAQIGKLVAGVRDKAVAEMPSTEVCGLLESLQEDVEDVLGENGVAAYRAEVSPNRSTRCAKRPSRKTVPTDRRSPLRNGRGVSRPRVRTATAGFSYKARVAAYRSRASRAGFVTAELAPPTRTGT